MMLVLRTIGLVLAMASMAAAAGPPAAKTTPVTDTYHGVKVVDPYRWLEDWDDAEVRRFSDAQNAHARRVLDNLPQVEAIRARLTELMTAETVRYGSLAYHGGRLFAIKVQPPKQQPFLVVMPSPDEPQSQRVLVDPMAIDPQGTTSIDWYKPSPDGKLVAVSLSEGGSESGDVHVYDTATGREVHEVIPRVNGGTAGGNLAWAPDASGFYYTRYPREGERPAADVHFFVQVYYHALGTPTAKDRYEIGRDFPRIAEIELQTHLPSGRVLATVQFGDGGEFAHYLRSPKGKWRQFSRFGDKVIQAAFGRDDDLLVLSRADAPRGKILRVQLDSLDVAGARTVIPQGKDSIVSSFWGKPTILATASSAAGGTASRLYVVYQLGGPSEIRVFDHRGNRKAGPRQLPISTVGELTHLDGDVVLLASQSFIRPYAVYRFDPQTGKTEKTALAADPPVDFRGAKVVREMATSRDGTKVPLNIIMPKNARLDGSHPCVVTGYGGYGINIQPRFNATSHLMLQQGVIRVVTNLRGGSEYGEQWHLQGNLTNKQNVFDDFAAVLGHLIDRGYTSPERLAIIGGSNGGLLMGATMTQHPDLVRAVVSFVGIYDMLRVELSPNGAFNVPEFGTVKNPEHFKALLAYSPYHRVKDGTAYPATLLLTGANDPRVDPMQSRKMTARLQAATSSSSAPVLLRTSTNTGHGGGTALDERIEQYVDVYAFLFHQLGVKYRPVAK